MMTPFFQNKALLITLDLLALLLCIAGIEQSRQKSAIRAEVHPEYGANNALDSLRVRSILPGEDILRPGDVLLSIGGHPIRDINHREQILDTYHKGETVSLVYRRGGDFEMVRYRLSAYYSTFDMLMQSGGVLIFFALAFFVLSRRPGAREAMIFHLLAITVAGVIALTHGHYMMSPAGIGHLLRALLPSIYAFLGVLVLHFSLVFPRPRPLRRGKLVLLYTPSMLLTLAGLYTSYRATVPFALEHAADYFTVLTLSRVYMVLGAAAGIFLMLRNFRRSSDAIMRRQVAWVMIGVGFSVLVYMLWQATTTQYVQMLLPAQYHALLESVRIDESILILSLVMTASFMSIGIIRYRFFDIEFFFRRGTVVTVVMAILMFSYAVILYGLVLLFPTENRSVLFIFSLLSLLVVLWLFIPVRDLVQRTVDRWFFRVEYDFRESLTRISRDITQSVEAEEVASVIVRGIDALMHLQGVMVMLVREGTYLDVLAYTGFPRWNAPGMTIREQRLRNLPQKPIVLGDVLETGADAVELRMRFAERFGVVMILPIRSENGDVLGILSLGDKRSGTRFTLEDMDLLHSITTQAGLHLERLQLQENLVMEKNEAARLRELSQMKSYFVSGVSHDLKTPLTSIKLFAELLEQQLPEDDAPARKYVSIMQGECDRLGRLINNVLDFTKIERGMMKYTFAPMDLNSMVRRAYDVMQYQFSMGGFQCELACSEEELTVEADADALLEALTNLLSNAMKYSGEGRIVHLRTYADRDQAYVAVQDFGLGIAQDDLAHLFEPFYRSRTGDVQKHGGVGLGLALVKHIVDAHKGNIRVASVPGEGSTFTISLRIMEAV
jgi:signal transduction histidine kinase